MKQKTKVDEKSIKEITLITITNKVLEEMRERDKERLPNYLCIRCFNVSTDRTTWYVITDIPQGITYLTDVCPRCYFKKD